MVGRDYGPFGIALGGVFRAAWTFSSKAGG
jgi:hypothetical protein